MPLVGVLGGLAFGLPLMAFSAGLTEDKGQFALVQRFVFTPLFLFSGTFFPLTTLPVWLQWIGWISPHLARERDRPDALVRLTAGCVAGRLAPGDPRRCSPRRLGHGAARVREEVAGRMTTTTTEPTHKATISSLYARNARSVVARGLKATKSTNWVDRAVRVLRAGVLPARDGPRAGHVHRRRRAAERRVRLVRGVHRAGTAGRVRDERRGVRLDVERVLQDALRQALRRDARHVARARWTSRSARSRTRCCAAASTPSAS